MIRVKHICNNCKYFIQCENECEQGHFLNNLDTDEVVAECEDFEEKSKRRNQMRLIDADALKEAFYNRKRTPDDMKYLRVPAEVVYEFINNAPTIDMDERDADAFESGYIEGLNAERQKGKWIDVPCERDLLFNTGIKYTCSVCGKFNSNGHSSFCPDCGADMRGDKK